MAIAAPGVILGIGNSVVVVVAVLMVVAVVVVVQGQLVAGDTRVSAVSFSFMKSCRMFSGRGARDCTQKGPSVGASVARYSKNIWRLEAGTTDRFPRHRTGDHRSFEVQS